MAPHADDEDEPTGGPPPDPTMRAWRHPSEIASAEAAAARFRRQDEAARLRAPSAAAPVPMGFHPERPGGRAASTFLTLTALTAATVLAVVAVGTGLFYADVDGAGRADQLSSSLTAEAGGRSSIFGSDSAAIAPLEVAPVSATTRLDLEPWAMTTGIYTTGRSPARLAGVTVADGVLLTSASALTGHSELTLEAGSLSAPVAVRGTDDVTDIAVLELSGAQAGAVLAALSGEQTQSAVQAEVTATGRTSRTRAGMPVYGTLQTDTRCPDAGGMPLFDDGGELVGVIVDSSNPIVSAVPIDQALAVARSLAAGTGSSPAWLGLNGRAGAKGGAVLTGVAAGSPAALAGLQVGDRVISFDGRAVADWLHLTWLVRQAGPGAQVTIEIDRDGARSTRQATVGTRKP